MPRRTVRTPLLALTVAAVVGAGTLAAPAPDRRHPLTFDVNGDWLPDPARSVDVAEAEFCGAPPAPAGGDRSAPRPAG
ncbi:hypothetical protein ABTY53_03380 [Streptomyces noursei]|uniref:hypothetical protein n=1 Tax=Streptomyces noursei TaxID=1971 RepID=UPI00332C9706